MHAPTPDFRYRREVLKDAPVLYWPLDRSFAYDFRPASSPVAAAITGTYTPAPGPFPGSGSTFFDGSTMWYDLAFASAGFLNTANFSFDLWTMSLGNDFNPEIISFSDASTGWRLGLQTTSSNGWRLSQPGVNGGTLGSAVVGQWYHVAVRFGSGLGAIYINGQLLFDLTTTTAANASGDFVVGNKSDLSHAFNGLVAHVACYNYTLSPSRIAAHYRAGFIQAQPPSRRTSMTIRPRAMPRRPIADDDTPPYRRLLRLIGAPSYRILRGTARFAPPPEEMPYRQRLAPRMIDFGRRYASASGLYRVFNAAGYRFYKSNSAPPAETDTPFATSASLPSTPADTFANGTWYLSASYFNGVIDSGFLPLGTKGETYVLLEISGGAAQPTRPSQPTHIALQLRPGGVVRINAFYLKTPDAPSNMASQWAIAYTTNGATPPNNTPSITVNMGGSSLQVLAYDLPAQADGTTVKVQLQVRTASGPVYSFPSTVLTITADATGPSAPLQVASWVGGVPNTEGE